MIKLFYGPTTFRSILVKLYYMQSSEEEEEVEKGNNTIPASI